jgi:hypothetical protein
LGTTEFLAKPVDIEPAEDKTSANPQRRRLRSASLDRMVAYRLSRSIRRRKKWASAVIETRSEQHPRSSNAAIDTFG